MAVVLLVDDDESLLDILAMSFEDAGFEVLTARDGLEARGIVEQDAPDLIVSDVNMPRLDGFSLCRQLREKDIQTPLILLTSRDTEIDEALGLELGADDYVAKPFNSRVLIARTNALLRRDKLRRDSVNSPDTNGSVDESEESVMCAGDLELHQDRLEVTFQGELVEVTVTEFRLLEVFARRPGIVFSRNQLLDRIRGDDSVVADRIIDTYVRRLRRKFEKIDPAFDCIETVVGAGYRWRQ